jgi:hypothetical protein
MMKKLIKISAVFIFVLVAFSSCTKDEKVIPDVTGSTYEVYKMETSFMGQSATTNISNTDEDYYKWKFVSGGILEDGNGNEIGTWTQNGEDVVVTELILTYNCKVSNNELIASYSFLVEGKMYMRKI